ncbi:hypothetical protein M9H77_02022 [Catharanthus roseus]|uniref:Uncharacterized protein n=1 Tax=Catharanthus roseus TaxID=4058 RepID=A0ACC0C772_CATRO|nr:hypothetical protein M9H77_02022 [Catharanthus roseus]
MEEQLKQTEQFRKSHVQPRNILRFFQEQNVGCAKIYNVVAKIKKNRMQGNCEDSDVLSDIVVGYPTSIVTIRTWPFVLIMDTTYETNKVQYATVESNRVDTDRVNIPSAQAQDMDSEMRDLASLLDQISTGPILKVKELRRIIKGVLKRYKSQAGLVPVLDQVSVLVLVLVHVERADHHERLGVGVEGVAVDEVVYSVIDPSTPSISSYINAFPGFVYQFIQNWKNVIGDGNCRFQVVANFVFRDENQWSEVHRRLSFELQHMTNMVYDIIAFVFEFNLYFGNSVYLLPLQTTTFHKATDARWMPIASFASAMKISP